MPARSHYRLLGSTAAVGAVMILGWASGGRLAVAPTRRATASFTTSRNDDSPVRVRLDALSDRPSAIDGSSRDPFSTRHLAVVMMPPARPIPEIDRAAFREVFHPPPTITAPFKFMGILQKRTGEMWGIFADCAGYTRAAREGESVLGTWRVRRLGTESVFIESLDGQGLTLALGGCGPRST